MIKKLKFMLVFTVASLVVMLSGCIENEVKIKVEIWVDELSSDNAEKISVVIQSNSLDWASASKRKEIIDKFLDGLSDTITSYNSKRIIDQPTLIGFVLKEVQLKPGKVRFKTEEKGENIRYTFFLNKPVQLGNKQTVTSVINCKNGGIVDCSPGIVSEEGKRASIIFRGPKEFTSYSLTVKKTKPIFPLIIAFVFSLILVGGFVFVWRNGKNYTNQQKTN